MENIRSILRIANEFGLLGKINDKGVKNVSINHANKSSYCHYRLWCRHICTIFTYQSIKNIYQKELMKTDKKLL